MFRRQWLSVVVGGNDHARIEKISDWKIGLVPTLTVKQDKASRWPQADEIREGP